MEDSSSCMLLDEELNSYLISDVHQEHVRSDGCVVLADDANLRAEKKELLKQLQLLLTERPIWTLDGLTDQLPGHTAHEIEALLPRLAYVFRSGALSAASSSLLCETGACMMIWCHNAFWQQWLGCLPRVMY